MAYNGQAYPAVIPAAGGKLIEEHFSRVATKDEGFSIATVVLRCLISESLQAAIKQRGAIILMCR